MALRVFSRIDPSGLVVAVKFSVEADMFDKRLGFSEPADRGRRPGLRLTWEDCLIDGGVAGGVGGRLMKDPVLMDRGLDGGRYVMPMPLCSLVRSCFGARSATVTSPAAPLGENGGIRIR